MLLTFCLASQDFTGYVSANYSGIHRLVYRQPASLASNHLKFDINLFSLNFQFTNSIAGLNLREIYDNGLEFDDYDSFKSRYIIEHTSGKNGKLYQQLDLLGPAFLWSINKNQGVALTTRLRLVLNMDNISRELSHLALNRFEVPELWEKDLKVENASFDMMAWVEYGASYGRTVFKDGPHLVKAGGSLKLLQGLTSGYFHVNASYRFKNDEILSVKDAEIKYGHSVSFNEDWFTLDGFKYNFNGGGIGFDFGVEYEYRGESGRSGAPVTADQEGGTSHANPYIFKAGFALIDLGWVRFEKKQEFRNGELTGSFDYTGGFHEWDLSDVKIESLDDFDDLLNDSLDISKNDRAKYAMRLPVAMVFEGDYRIIRGIYLNLTGQVSPVMKRVAHKLHTPTFIALTPRYENKWFSISLPFSLDNFGNFNLGTYLSMGNVLIIGVNNIGTFLWKDELNSLQFNIALKSGIPFPGK